MKKPDVIKQIAYVSGLTQADVETQQGEPFPHNNGPIMLINVFLVTRTHLCTPRRMSLLQTKR